MEIFIDPDDVDLGVIDQVRGEGQDSLALFRPRTWQRAMSSART